MTDLGSVRVTVTVDVDPATAFVVFTDEIGEWYRGGVRGLLGVDRPETLRFEPGVGGRLLEVGRADGDKERARVTVWEPGERLAFVDASATEVDVRFEAVGARTRVVLEHRGFDQLTPEARADVGKHGWKWLAGWFEQYVEATAGDRPDAPSAGDRRTGDGARG